MALTIRTEYICSGEPCPTLAPHDRYVAQSAVSRWSGVTGGLDFSQPPSRAPTPCPPIQWRCKSHHGRKTIEKLMGHFVYTGQEKPVGNKQGVRQDLVKKFATGEGMSGRMPYGILTKLYKVIGWKRLKLNKMISFDDIEERNFESILRRFSVIRLQSRLVEPGTLPDIPCDAAQVGVFSRDAELETFYVSGPATAAGLKLQYAFEQTHDLEECRRILVQYTRLGGDHGVGLTYLREACGLKPLAEVQSAGAASGLGPLALLLEPDSGEKATSQRVEDATIHLARGLMKDKTDFLTESAFAKMYASVASVSGLSKEALWKRLKEGSLWKQVGKRGKANANLFPVIPTVQPIQWLYASPVDFSMGKSDADVLPKMTPARIVDSMPERYNTTTLREFVRAPARKANVETLIGALSGERDVWKRRHRGHVVDSPEYQEIVHRLVSLQEMERFATEMLEWSDDPCATPIMPSDPTSPKRRRLTRKQTDPNAVSH